MPASQPAYFNLQQFSDIGVPLLGGRLYTYAQGTTAHKTAYTDAAGAVPQTYTADGLGGQYIALNARGELAAPLYLATGSYDIVLRRADGSAVWSRRADPTGDGALVTQAGVAAIARTAQEKLRESVSVLDFGADPSGAADSTVAINAAIASLGVGGGVLLFPRGDYRITATITVSTPVTLKGVGRGFWAGLYNSRIIKDGNFRGIVFAQGSAYGGARDLTIHGTSGTDTFDGIYVASGRVSLDHLNIQNHGGHGLNIYDANCSSFTKIRLFQNRGNGLHIEGAPALNVNGMFFHDLDIQLNTGHGINIQTGFSNFFFGVTLQLNGGYGINIPDGDRNRFFGVYSEGNTLGSLNFGATALANKVYYGIASDHIVVADPSGANSWDVPGDDRSIEQGGILSMKKELRLGDPNSGAPGYQLTLEGTGGSVVVPVRSSGAGVLTLDIQALSIDASTAPALLGAWVNFGGSRKPAGYYKDRFGQVSLEGTVKSGVLGTAIMTLPGAYRPSGRVRFAVSTLNGAVQTFGSVIVDSDGNVYGDAGGTTEFCLDGIKFKAVP
jgi:hypothetical protein